MPISDISSRLPRRTDAELKDVRNHVLEMGGLVERQLSRAVSAIVTGDSQRALDVVNDDDKINDFEIRIDEECRRILADKAPIAGDFRSLIAVIKTVTDLERIGDEAKKISLLACQLSATDRPTESYHELKSLGDHVAIMLRDAMNAFARLDVDESYRVVAEDEQVDAEHESIIRQCMTSMLENPSSIRRSLDVIGVARAMERIGDHTKNVCEYVIYMVRGKDVRHTSYSDVSKLVDQQ